MSKKLNEVQQSVDFFVSLLLGNDAKKGEKISADKSKADLVLRQHDET